MSELIQDKVHRTSIRWRLLAGVSAVALTAHIASADLARAEDSGRPTVWIELGGQLSRLQGGQETFAPPLMDGRPAIFESSQKFEKPPSHSFDGFGDISIQPSDSSWVFSVSVRYGRSKSGKRVVQQTSPQPFQKYFFGTTTTKNPIAEKFAQTDAHSSEQHTVLDFQVGKDVGLGMFGSEKTVSTVSFGVRFAQFSRQSNITLRSDPDWHFNYKYLNIPSYGITNFKAVYGQPYHSNFAHLATRTSFHGIGPSVSWKGSIPVVGNKDAGTVAFDWGANAALLFGRQKAQTHHQTIGKSHAGGAFFTQPGLVTVYNQPAVPDHTRTRSVVVPNVGGLVGLSFSYPNAKISMGYRADFFFGAMDGGIDMRKTYDRDFYGPFATISIGL